MTKTREITEGSMYLAIIIALVLFDRNFSFFFEDLILLLIPACIVLFGLKYGEKDSLILSFAFSILFLFGNITTFLYLPVGVVVGQVFLKTVRKGGKCVMKNIIFVFSIAETVITLLVMPLLGISIESQLGNKFGRISCCSFSFMIIFIAFLESYFLYLLTFKLLKISKNDQLFPFSLSFFTVSKRECILFFLICLTFPIFFFIPLNNIFCILFTIWSYSYIYLLINGILKWFSFLKDGMIKNKVFNLFLIFLFPVTFPIFSLF